MTGKSPYRVAVVYHAPVYQEGIGLVLDSDPRLRTTSTHATLDALALAVQSGLAELPDVVLVELAAPWEALWGALLRWRTQWPTAGLLVLGELTELLAQGALAHGAHGVVALADGCKQLMHATHCVADGGLYKNSWMEHHLLAGRNGRVQRQANVPKLTPKEAEVLRLMARRDSPTYATMATELGVSERTVHTYRDVLFRKFGVHTRGALVFRARELRLV